MAHNNKIKRIRYLMIFSQMLITAFLVYWLTERYSFEKAELRKDLLREFEYSEQKMLDTLIRLKVLNPLRKEEGIHNTPTSTVDIHKVSSFVRIEQREGNKSKSAGTVYDNDSLHVKLDLHTDKFDLDTIMIRDTGMARQKKLIQVVKDPGSEKMLIEGVKVFLSIVDDTTFGTASSTAIFSDGLDTTVLKTEFNEKMSAHKLKPLWIRHNDTDDIRKAKIYIPSEMLNSQVGVAVENYNFYLVRKLTPNILFSLLLLIITGAAFIISYFNLKKQMQLNTVRDEFVGNITHELKTPVATVKVALEALNKFNVKDDPAKTSDYIKMASMELDRLDYLIQKVLNSSIYESESGVMNFETINLEQIVQEALNTMQLRFDRENAKVTFNHSGSGFSINGDRIHLQGVITNLIDNSLKYTEGNPVIMVNLSSTEKEVTLSITDDGTGLPDEYKSKVFDKFFRVPANNIHNVKGYGLGLYYISQIVKQSGGTITVKNNDTMGCTFTLIFPKIKE